MGASTIILGLAVASALPLLISCGGDDGEECPGVICTNCGASGDCNIECSADEVETCVGLEFFGSDNPDDLRCAFCE